MPLTPASRDLSPYAGLWVALIRGEVTGVGRSEETARLASLNSRPKEIPNVMFVPPSQSPTPPGRYATSRSPISLPPLFDEIRSALRQLRSKAPIWLVGGAVRDALLGRESHDLDFVAAGDALELSRGLADALHAAFYPLDEQRGTGRIILDHGDERYFLDFAALRAGDLPGDLALRDFTLNALAVSLDDPETPIDPLGGEADLRAKLIRACGPTSLSDDPVRCLRAVRLAAQFDFRIQKETREMMKRETESLRRASAERVRDEFIRLLGGRRPSAAIRALDMLDLLEAVVPETAALKGVTQSPPHVFDVWNHTLAVLERLEDLLIVLGPRHDPDAAADLALGLAAVRLGRYREQLHQHLTACLSSDRPARWLLFLSALFHDIAKPKKKSVDADGTIHFYEHEHLGAEIALRRAQKLRFSADEVKRVQTTVDCHMRPLLLAAEKTGPSRRAIYRFFRAAGEAGVDVCLLALADSLATWGPEFRQAEWTRMTEVVAALLQGYFENPEEIVQPPPLVNGRDLIAHFGLEEGPLIGQLLEAIREAQAAGEIKDRAEALELTRVTINQRSAPGTKRKRFG